MLIIARGQKEGQPQSQSKAQFNTFFIHKEHIFKAKKTHFVRFSLFSLILLNKFVKSRKN